MGATLDAVRAREREIAAERRKPPVTRLWSFPQGRALEQKSVLDGPMLEHLVGCEDSFELPDPLNDTGIGTLTIDARFPAAGWLVDWQSRRDAGLTDDVLLTQDYVGRRWSGFLRKVKTVTDGLGSVKVTATFESDFEQFKARTLWATPSTPAGFQPIKQFILAGPGDWALGTALKLNLERAHGRPSGLSWTDPLADGDADYRRWPIALKPLSYSRAAARGGPTELVSSRFDNFADVAQPVLEDAGLKLCWRRYMPGDANPWAGANISYGTLVVWFEDIRSGLANETGGGLGEGIVQLAEILADAVVEGIGAGPLPIEIKAGDPINPPSIPEYDTPGYLGTAPSRPYVLYTADSPGVVSTESEQTLAKYHRFTAGGHSMPMVNEMIEAGINFAAAAVAAIPLAPIPDVGPALNALLKPFYTDVFLAFMSVYLRTRGEYLSDFSPYEYFVPGADKAYTLSASIIMRDAMRATAMQWEVAMEVEDGMPWWIGAPGHGHFDVGSPVLYEDRVTKRILIHHVQSVTLAAERGKQPGFKIGLGTRDPVDAFGKAMEKIKALASSMHSLGVL